MHDVAELRKNVAGLCRAFIIAFLALSLWLAYWHVVRAPALRADAHNPRARERLKVTQPGRVLSADRDIILEGRRDNEVWYLEYPGRETYSHLTGYNARTGLQATLREPLYGTGSYEDPWVRILRGRLTGCDITLTINGEAQALATELMARHVGAVVAIDPRTGGVLVMVSAPAYDPTTVLLSSADWQLFRNHPDKLELNRALLGQYAPGSVLKVFTAAAALDAGFVAPDDEFTCRGETQVGGSTIRCRRARGHGKITLTEALADSCNVIFADVGRGLGPTAFRDYVQRFGLLETPALHLPVRGGRMPPMDGETAEAQVAEAAFGQGAVLLSPLGVARLTATIAARGLVPDVHLVQSITGPQGKRYTEQAPATQRRAISAEAAEMLAGMMVQVVEEGTGRRARIRGVGVAGKTGSAQNPAGPPHAWFAAFAPADSPRAAIAVIVEHGRAGGEVAAPIARSVLEVLLKADDDADGAARR